MSKTVSVKSEPTEGNDDGGRARFPRLSPAPVTPPRPTSGTRVDDNNDEDDDPIVRVIDVYVSPELAPTISLVQFPLRPSRPTTSSLTSASSRSGIPPPESARIKPMHGIVELDFVPPRTAVDAASSLRSLPDALSGAMRKRVHRSHSVQMRTHVALGKLDESLQRLDLVPLGRVVQMRPDFAHLNDHDDGDDGDEDDGLDDIGSSRSKRGKDDEKKRESKPLLFKRLESERTLAMKRSSYAFKKAKEDAEEWIEMDVRNYRTEEYRARCAMVRCPDPDRVLRLARSTYKEGGGVGADETYVRSLNYLAGEEVIGEDDDDDDDNDDDGMRDEDRSSRLTSSNKKEKKPPSARRARDLAARVASILQSGGTVGGGGGGAPVAFSILRSRIPRREASDEELAVAASACSVCVRGNLVLRTDLLGLGGGDGSSGDHGAGASGATSSKALGGGGKDDDGGKYDRMRDVRDARDAILYLLNKRGRIRREPLVRTFEELTVLDNDGDGGGGGRREIRGNDAEVGIGNGAVVNAEVVDALLDGVAENGRNSVELRVEDDVWFAERFPGLAELHRRYWERNYDDRLSRYVERYEELAGLS